LCKQTRSIFSQWETFEPEDLVYNPCVEIREFDSLEKNRFVIVLLSQNALSTLLPRFEKVVLPVFHLISNHNTTGKLDTVAELVAGKVTA